MKSFSRTTFSFCCSLDIHPRVFVFQFINVNCSKDRCRIGLLANTLNPLLQHNTHLVFFVSLISNLTVQLSCSVWIFSVPHYNGIIHIIVSSHLGRVESLKTKSPMLPVFLPLPPVFDHSCPQELLIEL